MFNILLRSVFLYPKCLFMCFYLVLFGRTIRTKGFLLSATKNCKNYNKIFYRKNNQIVLIWAKKILWIEVYLFIGGTTRGKQLEERVGLSAMWIKRSTVPHRLRNISIRWKKKNWNLYNHNHAKGRGYLSSFTVNAEKCSYNITLSNIPN